MCSLAGSVCPWVRGYHESGDLAGAIRAKLSPILVQRFLGHLDIDTPITIGREKAEKPAHYLSLCFSQQPKVGGSCFFINSFDVIPRFDGKRVEGRMALAGVPPHGSASRSRQLQGRFVEHGAEQLHTPLADVHEPEDLPTNRRDRRCRCRVVARRRCDSHSIDRRSPMYVSS